MGQIDSIMNPESIAVIGATNRSGSVGQAVFSNVLNCGYKGILYPVNPNVKSVLSVKAYSTILDVPDNVDLAVIVVPRNLVYEVMEAAAKKGVKGAIVISAGFKEVGGEGVTFENQLKALVKRCGIRLIGPNCLGIINTSKDVQMNASFATTMPKRGNIAFISQSGALCTAVLDFAKGEDIGFSKFISFGNKADVSEIDLLRYLKDDPDTDVILMYLEDITDGRGFINVASEIAWKANKPMLAIKSGRSEEGARAVMSHTGSLAGSDRVYDAIFYQSGIQRVEEINELFNYAVAFANQPLPKGKRIAIITNAGGPGIMATDAAIRHELELAILSDGTREKLRSSLPESASLQNPVDVVGDATHERYEAAIRSVLMDEGVDGAIVILTPQAMTDILETAEIVPRAIKGINKTILCSFMGIVDVSEGVMHLKEHCIPNYPFPETAVRTFSSMVGYSERLRMERRSLVRLNVGREAVARIIQDKLQTIDRFFMNENEAVKILELYGFPLLKSRLVNDQRDIKSALEYIGLPVAMKISSSDIIHKFDVGGVRLNIGSEQEARNAFTEIIQKTRNFNPDASVEGVYMQKMAKKGVEVILGAVRDRKFGPMCMFGLGGTFVEVFKDVSFRLAPMWELSAELMITSTKAYDVLRGIRGIPPSDIKSIKNCILRLSQLISDHPEIVEADINPLIVYNKGEGCVVADSRIYLRR